MAREARKLTKTALDALRKQAQADGKFSAYVADAGQPGLYAWARRGRVRFVFAYRPPGGGRRQRLKIDEYGAITLKRARKIAEQWRGLVAGGQDPQRALREEARAAATVGQAIGLYLEDLRQRAESGAKRGKRSGYASAKRRLERHILPQLGRVRLRELTAEQVKRVHRGMRETPVEANRTLTAFSAVFGYADRLELVPPHFNPCRHVERNQETGRRRALTVEELRTLGEAIHEAEQGGTNPSAVLALRLLALTGFRRSELLGHTMRDRRTAREGLRWGDVDLDAGTVRLRDTKTGAQTRVIGSAVVDLLASTKPEGAQDDEPICAGSRHGEPLVGIDKLRVRIYESAGLGGLRGVDLHSLRHTFASIGAHVANGRYAAFIGPLLGHGYQKRSITERYIHSNPEALRPAADAISEAMAAHLGLREPAQLIAFRHS